MLNESIQNAKQDLFPGLKDTQITHNPGARVNKKN